MNVVLFPEASFLHPEVRPQVFILEFKQQFSPKLPHHILESLLGHLVCMALFQKPLPVYASDAEATYRRWTGVSLEHRFDAKNHLCAQAATIFDRWDFNHFTFSFEAALKFVDLDLLAADIEDPLHHKVKFLVFCVFFKDHLVCRKQPQLHDVEQTNHEIRVRWVLPGVHFFNRNRRVEI